MTPQNAKPTAGRQRVSSAQVGTPPLVEGHTQCPILADAHFAGNAAQQPQAAPQPLHSDPFIFLNSAMTKWFYKPDLQAIRIALGTIKAHYLNIGDPAWLFVVAPPGTGKTTMSIVSASGLSEVVALGDITENTFLSGFYGQREPGLLEKLGYTTQLGDTYTTEGSGILLAKDFTTVLTMRREKRGVILSQLREIHDGEFKRSFGTGVTKIFRGRVSVVAAVTPVLDRHYSIFSVLGERFLQVRWHRPDSAEAGEWAIQQQGKEAVIQREVRDAITQLFKDSTAHAPELPRPMQRRLASFAEVMALARTHVFRSSYGSREIEYVPEPEANTRISKGLAAVAKGIAALNQRVEVAEPDIQDALRVSLDCLPENRRRLLLAVLKGDDPALVPIPRTIRGRELEELVELQILDLGATPAKLTPRIAGLIATANPKL
jgi:hypothetical protein